MNPSKTESVGSPSQLWFTHADALVLAQIAAVLMRPGVTEADAVVSAHRLIRRADDYLAEMEMERLLHARAAALDLEGMMSRLGIKRIATLRGYVFSVVGDGEAARLWDAARNGDRVFTIPLRERILGYQAELRRMRSAKAAEGRTTDKKILKKTARPSDAKEASRGV